MRVSQYFGVRRTQPYLDFVDVDLATDLKLYVDPRALRLFPSEWGRECVALVQDFFGTVLAAVRANDRPRGLELLSELGEPNETRLGLSSGLPRGRALGPDSALAVWEAFSQSEAARTGLLDDLEDALLMVEGVGPDIVSDITTNVIREPLIHYTQHVAGVYGIPLTPGVDSGALWNPVTRRWWKHFVDLPMADHKKVLLIPKMIVRLRMDYDVDEYYRHHVLTYLQGSEIEAKSSLMYLLKDGTPRVDKSDLIERWGQGKHAAIKITLGHPEILEGYRAHKSGHISPPLDHRTLAAAEDTEPPNWAALLTAIMELPPGPEHASEFHRHAEDLCTALFYPALSRPVHEAEIHEGRKRIDISYVNVAVEGFFYWLSRHYASMNIFMECKNYSSDPANPEYDQLSGRFSPNRGRIGFLICRSIENRPLAEKRCRDAADDGRGYLLPLDDSDMTELVHAVQDGSLTENLMGRFRKLIM